MKIDGACHCGRITYEADIDTEMVGICLCTDCQQLSASAFRTVVIVPGDRFTCSGEPKEYIKTGDSGNRRILAFCPDCGSAIYATGVEDGPKAYNLRGGTIRQRRELVPKFQFWARSAMPWLHDLKDVPAKKKQ